MSAATESSFQALLRSLESDSVEENGTVYGLWPDLRLAYVNKGWNDFAKDNNGPDSAWPLGRSILDAISPPVRAFFQKNYERVLKEGRPFEHVYECSSADQYREFHQKAFPLGKHEGLLVINSLKVARPMFRKEHEPDDKAYRDADGMIHQCSHCRRVQRQDTPTQWDWVPDYVAKVPVKCTHDLCKPCYSYYYNDENMMSGEFPEPIRSDDLQAVVEGAVTSLGQVDAPSAVDVATPSGDVVFSSPSAARKRALSGEEVDNSTEVQTKRPALESQVLHSQHESRPAVPSTEPST